MAAINQFRYWGDDVEFLRKRWWLLCLGPMGLILTYLASWNGDLVSRIYTGGFYLWCSRIIGGLFSLLPVSAAELIIYGGSLAIILWIVRTMLRAVSLKAERRNILLTFLWKTLSIVSVVYFIFVIFCGINYSNLSFLDQSGLLVRDSSSQELAALCADLVDKANALRVACDTADDGTASLSQSVWETAVIAPSTYGGAAQRYPILGGWAPRTKPVIWSRGMSSLNITGVFTPFTFEANVNVDVPAYTIPAAMNHELAHYKGFMREDEANFISYLACVQSGRPDFAYSGVMLALTYSSNQLYSADKDAYWQVMEPLSDLVRADLEANSLYWKAFEGPVAQASTKVNDVYLRSNRQTAGVKSYGRMVDLLLADYREGASPLSLPD